LAGLLIAADPPPPAEDEAVGRFWAQALQGPVTSRTWAAADDPPAVVQAKSFLGQGFGDLLAQCQYEPGRNAIRIEDLDDLGTERITIGRYVVGDIQYIGLVSAGPQQRVRIFFPGGEFQYEPMENRFAGKSDGAGIMLMPHRVHWLAVYPYQVTGMSLRIEPRQARPGDRVKAEIRLSGSSPPGLHRFRILAVDPEGAALPGYPQYVMAPEGRATVEMTLPKDATAGNYGLSARCVVTAALAADTVTVTPEAGNPQGAK
jgi:hypothetical protein